jgi:hypothetical protein
VLLVATVARPGKAAAQHAAKEISGLVACEVVNCKSGRIFFRVLASAARVLTEEKLLQACQIEKVSVVVHRHESDPVGTFLAFEGVSPESSVKRIVDLAKSKDFGRSLFRSTAYWRLIQKKTILQELSFRCTAKRATSVGKKILPSSIFGRAFGLALESHYPGLLHSVDLCSPSLEISLHLNHSEFLVAIPLFCREKSRGHGSWQIGRGLHPSICWALTRTLDLEKGDVVLDPMCGRANLLVEGALNWPACSFVGCDVDPSQIDAARANVSRAGVDQRVTLFQADSSTCIPMADNSVHKVCVDVPFGKQFGSVQENETLYPLLLCEMARVTRCGGKAVLLTSVENEATLRASLATVCEGNKKGMEEPDALGNSWKVDLRYGFMLFSKMRARVFVLTRTASPPPRPCQAVERCKRAAKALRGHSIAMARKYRGEADWDVEKPTLFVSKLGKAGNSLPWDNGTAWEQQWRLSRPLMVRWEF